MVQKIILVDDQKIFRQSLTATLHTAGEVQIIAEASNGEDFLALLENH